MTHGGKRDNAGRPKLPASKVKKPVCLKLSPDVIKWLKKQPAGIGPTVELIVRNEIESERE